MLQLDEPIDVYHCWIDECEERMLEAASSPAPLAPDHRSQSQDDVRGRLIPPGMGHQQQPLSPPQQSQQRLPPSPRQQQRLFPGPSKQQQPQHLSPDVRDMGPATMTPHSQESSGLHPQSSLPLLPSHPAHEYMVMQRSSPVLAPKAEQIQSHEGGFAAAAADAAGQRTEEGTKAKRKRLILKIPAKLAA